MTASPTGPIAVPGGAGSPAPPGDDAEVLARADGVELLGEVPGSGYRRPPALARRADGQVLTLTPLLHQVLSAVDGRRTVAEVAERVGEATAVAQQDAIITQDIDANAQATADQASTIQQ